MSTPSPRLLRCFWAGPVPQAARDRAFRSNPASAPPALPAGFPLQSRPRLTPPGTL